MFLCRYPADISPVASNKRNQLHHKVASLSSNASAMPSRHSYADPSPPSHDSSPHMVSHNNPSPQIQQHNNSPQMTMHQQTTYTPYSDGNNIGNRYTSTTTQGGIYESVSPSTACSSSGYTNVALDGLSSVRAQQQSMAPHHHKVVQQQNNIQQITSSPNITPYEHQQPSPMSVAGTKQQSQQIQTSHTVRAQADSTTKSKRGRSKAGGSRGGRSNSKGGGAPGGRKKKDETLVSPQGLIPGGGGELPVHLIQQSDSQQLLSMSLAAAGSGMMTSATPTILTCPSPSMSMHQQHQQLLQQQQQGLEAVAHGYEVTGINDEALLHMNMAQGMLGMESNAALRAEQEAILLMNENPTNFMNPNELMQGDEESKQEVSTIEDNVGLGLTTLSDIKRKMSPVKAKKTIPDPADDEEFGHLSTQQQATGTPPTGTVKVDFVLYQRLICSICNSVT